MAKRCDICPDGRNHKARGVPLVEPCQRCHRQMCARHARGVVIDNTPMNLCTLCVGKLPEKERRAAIPVGL
jgi:hypothetical protein